MKLELVPVTISDAIEFVNCEHRHLKAPPSALAAISAALDGTIVGVALLGRPIARLADDGWTCEITRLCTDGTRNAGSFLYGRAWRLAQSLGYRNLITYTLPSEPGTSLKAAGYRRIGPAGGGRWSRASRPRVDLHPLQQKIRWEKSQCVLAARSLSASKTESENPGG